MAQEAAETMMRAVYDTRALGSTAGLTLTVYLLLTRPYGKHRKR